MTTEKRKTKEVPMIEVRALSIPQIAHLEGQHPVTTFKKMQAGRFVRVWVHTATKTPRKIKKYIPTEDLIKIINSVTLS